MHTVLARSNQLLVLAVSMMSYEQVLSSIFNLSVPLFIEVSLAKPHTRNLAEDFPFICLKF